MPGPIRRVALLCLLLATVPLAAPSALAEPYDLIGPQTGYAVVAPAEFREALDPLLELRERQGLAPVFVALEEVYGNAEERDPERLAEYIRGVDEGTCGTLEFVFLVGDWSRGDRGEAATGTLPAFYLPKVRYRAWGGGASDYASDYPYTAAVREGGDRLFLGRLPARTVEEVRDYVAKVVAYETQDAPGPWQRRVLIFAGPANYSPGLDLLIEAFAYNLLENGVPYDFNPRLMFAKLGSPWCYRLDRMGPKIVEELNSGALFGFYAGHGRPGSFDHVRVAGRRYAIGDAKQLRELAIQAGNPFFISLTCHNGTFDLPQGKRSVAEELVLHPKGAVATFAASGVSHPYPNALYARAFVDTFLEERQVTAGEGIATLKKSMAAGTIAGAQLLLQADPAELKKEHLGLYNLLGDPALRLRYPDAVDLDVSFTRVTPADSAPDEEPARGRAGKILVHVEADDLPMDEGRAVVTLEVRREVILEGLEPLPAGQGPDAMRAMARNWDRAQKKVVVREEVPVKRGAIRAVLAVDQPVPSAVVKVMAIGKRESAVGHEFIDLVP